MNWLAHAFLSPPEPLVCLGNLLADAIDPRAIGSLHPELRRGVAIHRAIDAAIHVHPAAMDARRALKNTRLRFSGVVTDVVWDYFLLKHWTKFSSEPVDTFIARVYGYERYLPSNVPGDAAAMMRAIVANDFFRSYRTLDGIREVLARLARRVELHRHRRLPLAEAVDDVRAHHAELDACFLRLFPDIVELSVRCGEEGGGSDNLPGRHGNPRADIAGSSV